MVSNHTCSELSILFNDAMILNEEKVLTKILEVLLLTNDLI